MIGKVVCMKPISRRKSAFTLVEIMVVVAIIAILAGLVLGTAGYATRKADHSKAVADMEKIKNGLEEYRLQYGGYPENLNEDNPKALSAALWEKPQDDGIKPFLIMKGWNDDAIQYDVLDPWGNPYHYYYNPKGDPRYAEHNNSKFGYDLWSDGPDKVEEADDINNWSGD